MEIPYQKLEKIGAGSFSTVYKGYVLSFPWRVRVPYADLYKCRIHKETKQLVAIKILNLDTAEGTYRLPFLYCLFANISSFIDEVEDIRTEISLLTQLKLADVQNVTRYYGCHLYGSKLWIIM